MSKLPITPLRRAASDFVAADGSDLVEDKLVQMCMTEPGELPWRPRFGVGLRGLLHRANDATTAELARLRIQEAADVWLGDGAAVTRISPSREETTLRLGIGYRVEGSDGQALIELPAPGSVS